ncbi:MAG: hypothetical protein DRO05_02875 [Thermoproteota archaeon]|nr:MAG: hypothetical protein DRO05_02875 [Candidatus Korarchaeota archaeon]
MKRLLIILLMLISTFPIWVLAQPYYYALGPVEVGNLSPRVKRSSPFVIDDKIITIRRGGNLLAAIDANSGDLLWEISLGGVAVPDFWADDRRVYVATGERTANYLIAIDHVTGRKIYYTKLPAGSDRGYNSRVLPVGDLILVPIEGGKLSAYDIASGEESWVLDLPAPVRVMVSKESTVYVSCGRHLIALNAESGEVIWDREFLSQVMAVGVCGDHLLAGIESSVYFVDPSTGETVFQPIRLVGGNVVAGEIPWVGDMAYIMTTGGSLNIIDLEELELDRTIRLARNAFDQPTIVGKLLVFWSRNDGIFLYDLNVDEELYIPEYGEFKPVFRVRLDPERWALVFLDLSGFLMSIKMPRVGFVVQHLEAAENLTVSIEGVVSLYSNDTTVPTIEVRTPDGDLLWVEQLPSVTPLVRTRRTSFSFKLNRPFSYVEMKVLMEDGNISWIHRIELPYEEAPPGAVGSATFLVSGLGTLTVGEPFEISGKVSVNVSGELEISVLGEGVVSRTVSLGWVDAGVENDFSIQTTPTAPGNLSIQLVARLNGTEVGKTTIYGNCVKGKLIEEISPSNVRLNKGDVVSLRVRIKNRLLDNAVLRIEASSDITNRSFVEIGPLTAGEEKGVVLSLKAVESGSSEIVVEVIHEGELVERASIQIFVEVAALTPTPTPRPSPTPVSPLESFWRLVSPVTTVFEPYIGVWGSRLVVMGLIAGIPLLIVLQATRARRKEERPTPIVREEERPEEIEIIKPRPVVREIPKPSLPPEALEVEVRAPTIPKDLEAKINEVSGRLGSLRQRAASLEEEGFTGLIDRAESLRKLLDDVRTEFSEGRYDYAGQLLERLESNMVSFEDYLESLEELLESWNKVEGRIKMMLSLWGRAPASLLTTVPEDLRIIALARFAKFHPEMKLELRDDELVLLEE